MERVQILLLIVDFKELVCFVVALTKQSVRSTFMRLIQAFSQGILAAALRKGPCQVSAVESKIAALHS